MCTPLSGTISDNLSGVDYKGLYSNTSHTKACIWNLTTSLCTGLVIEDMEANPADTLYLLGSV